MAAGGAEQRLQHALEDYLASMTGGGGQMRSAQTGGKIVQLAEQLLQELAGATGDGLDTPGQRAAQRGGLTAGPPMQAARGMMGGRGAPAGL